MTSASSQQAQPDDVAILYERGPCIVVNKPGGVLTQAPPGIDSLEVRLKRFLQSRSASADLPYLGVPHRLDRPASGAMVFAKKARAARHLAEQFETRVVEKTYWALVSGHVDDDVGTWQDYIRKIPGQARAELTDAQRDGSKLAILDFQVRARCDSFTWLEIQLRTGRTHQIRVQTSSRGHAILGDVFYGDTRTFGPQVTDERDRCIALHARTLSFYHPKTDERVAVSAPVPDYWPAEISTDSSPV